MSLAQRGFSLIELLIVVGVILIIAAAAVPNLLRSKHRANETSAVSSMHSILLCTVIYESGHPNIGFSNTATDMGPDNDKCLDESLINALNGGPPKSGYQFTYTITGQGAGKNSAFRLTAAPSLCGKSGVQTLYADETGIIRFTSNETANCPPAMASSPPLR